MSARRWFQGALLLAALGLSAAARPSSRSPQIVARVGGDLAGRVGDTLNVPITVDLTGAPGVRLGGYRMTVRFNPNVLSFQNGSSGTFAPPLVNTDSVSSGVLRMTAIQPSGADSVVTLAVGRFRVLSDTGASDITVVFDEMSGVAPTFDDLLPLLTVVNGTFCHASGRWGDVDGDGVANSRDALVALSRVVGMVLDTVRIDTLYTDTAGVHTDTLVSLRPGLADVDGDGQVTSRDALIIMSYAVGLPVPGFRIGLAAAGGGACGSGLGLTIALAPDTLDLQTAQTANAVVTARDAASHPISLSGATWTSSNTAVAGVTSPGFGIVARDPGVAVLTAGLGASYHASMVVRVVAHRSQWFVDAARSQAAIQTGSPAFPFAFIQDAFDAGQDGDTINVAPGTYEESVSSDISVYLRGDPVHPPVLDPRGASSYSAYNAGLSAGSRVAPMRIENLWIQHGRLQVYSHDFFARHVHIEASDSAYPALYFYSALGIPPGSPPAGVRRGAADLPNDTGNVVLDSVTVHGPWGVSGEAIYVGLADTAIIRNSAASRDSTTFPACNGNGPAGIKVNQASRTEISNTTVLNAPCVGIEVYQSAGSAKISGNTVDRTGGAGIAVSLPAVAFDHNTVTRIISGSSEAQAAGVLVYDAVIDSVTSVGDVIRNSGDRGFMVLGAKNARIDSLTVDSVGFDDTYTASGVEFWGGHLLLQHSRISNVFASGAPGVLAWTPDATRSVLESRQNVITNTAGQGLFASSESPGYGGGCGEGCAPPVQRGPVVQRGSMNYGAGPDTLISVGDSIRGAGYSAGYPAIEADHARRLYVDSAVVDSSGEGVDAEYTASVVVQRSVIRHSTYEGIYLYSSDSVAVRRTAIVGGNGLLLDQLGGNVAPGGSATIFGTSSDSGAYDGLDVYTGTSGVQVAVDSSRFAGNAGDGIYLQCTDCVDTAVVTRSTITGNTVGLYATHYSGEGYYGGFALTARGNDIFGNLSGGASNLTAWQYATIDADSNYWGGVAGPRCSGSAIGCDSTATGDYILSQGITFADWLTAPATDVMTAPRFLRTALRRPLLAAAVRPPRPTRAARPSAALRPARTSTPAHPFALRATPGQPQPRAPLMSWRRGQPPRPARIHHPAS